MPLPTRFSARISSKNQSKLNFRRVPDAKNAESRLSKVLSQYQLMRMVTKHLSSADLAHLTAASKECRAYVMGSETIYTEMKSSAVCDGSGMKARASCFHHFNGDVSKARVKCEGVGQPCVSCQARVCNSCRFHIHYLDNLECCRGDAQHWQYHEQDFGEMIDAIRQCHDGSCSECPNFHSGNFPIEAIRAAHLCDEPRERRFCRDCSPFPPTKKRKDNDIGMFDVFDMNDELYEWCTCDLVSQFVNDTWLCIPCFIKQEAEALTHRSKRDVYTWSVSKEGESAGDMVKHVKTEYLCDCGKAAHTSLLVECRWCELLIRTPEISLIQDEF